MQPSRKGKRGKQKTLSLVKSWGRFNNKSANRYVAIDHFLTNFETAYLAVYGRKVEVVYRRGYYYLGKLRFNHDQLEAELMKLLVKEHETYLKHISGLLEDMK